MFLFFPQFAVFLSLIIIVEIAAAIAGYMFRKKVSVEFHWLLCLLDTTESLFVFNSPSILCLHLAVSYRPGQSHWNDYQLQERYKGIQRRSG